MNMTVFLKVFHIDEKNVVKALNLEEIAPYLNIKTIVNDNQKEKLDVVECSKDEIF